MSGPGPREVLSAIVESGPDGVLLSAGMLATNADLFARRGAPVPVVRADWTVIDEAWKAESGEFHRESDKAGGDAWPGDASRAYGVANPSFSATLSGFKNGEDANAAGVTGSANVSRESE